MRGYEINYTQFCWLACVQVFVTRNGDYKITEPELKVRPMHLIQQLQLWKALDFRGKFFNCCKRLMHFLKPGFPISCKDRKHMFANTFLLSYLRMPLSLYSCNDRRYSIFTRNICNRYVDSFKTLFRT